MEELTATESKILSEAERLRNGYGLLNELPGVLKKAATKNLLLYELAAEEEDTRDFTAVEKKANELLSILSAIVSDYPSHIPQETKEVLMEPFISDLISVYNKWLNEHHDAEDPAFTNIGVSFNTFFSFLLKGVEVGKIKSIPTPGEITYSGKRLLETKEKYPYLAELIDDPNHDYGNQFLEAFLEEGSLFFELNEKDRNALTMYHAVVIMERNKIEGPAKDKLSIDLYNQYIERINAGDKPQEENKEGIPDNKMVNTILIATADHMTHPNPVDLPSLNGFLVTNVSSREK